MAYVPGFKSDIFVSYAHITDEPTVLFKGGWVRTFTKDLEALLKTKLGPDLSIWIDNRDLRRSADYHAKIKEEVQSSALLLTINSDPYLESIFSETEVKHFRESWTAAPTGEKRKIVQVYQSIGPSGQVPTIDGDLNGHYFCGIRTNPGGNGLPFEEESADYKGALKKLAREL